MPLQNRVDPFGEPQAADVRGLFMGNRGGRLHSDDRALGRRRWVSKQWICCRLDFNGRRRQVWGRGYTEFFFLDEVTALAAGHRPCFECRRSEARAFAAAWAAAHGLAQPPTASEIDRVLHAERLDGGGKRRHRMALAGLPQGTMLVDPGHPESPLAWRGDALLRWTAAGYVEAKIETLGQAVHVLTPPSVVGVLAAGYRAAWHPTAHAVLRDGARRP